MRTLPRPSFPGGAVGIGLSVLGLVVGCAGNPSVTAPGEDETIEDSEPGPDVRIDAARKADSSGKQPDAAGPVGMASDAGALSGDADENLSSKDAGTSAAPKDAGDARPAGAGEQPLLAPPAGPLSVGAQPGGKDFFGGSIDHLRIYNRVIATDRIVAHAQHQYEPCTADIGCIGDWTLDKVEGDAFPSSGPTPLPARLQGNVELIQGAEDGAIRISGNDAWLEVAQTPALALSDAFTLEAWVRRENCPRCGNYRTIVHNNPTFHWLGHASFWHVWMHGPGFSGTRGLYNGDTWPAVDVWKHIAVTYHRVNGFLYYANGKVRRTRTIDQFVGHD